MFGEFFTSRGWSSLGLIQVDDRGTFCTPQSPTTSTTLTSGWSSVGLIQVDDQGIRVMGDHFQSVDSNKSNVRNESHVALFRHQRVLVIF